MPGNCYPWDAAAYGRSVREHEQLAIECAGENRTQTRAVFRYFQGIAVHFALAMAAGFAAIVFLQYQQEITTKR